MTDGPFRLRPAARLGTGVVFLLLAVVVFAGAKLLSSGQDHSYVSGATPPATYRLTAEKTYQLSSPTGVAALTKAGALDNLTCTSTDSSGLQTPLASVATLSDDRDLRMFATFRAIKTGAVHIACDGIAKVFVDDADSSPTDFGAALLLVSALFGVIGVAAALSGAFELSASRPEPAHVE